jgi:hypothetical protein
MGFTDFSGKPRRLESKIFAGIDSLYSYSQIPVREGFAEVAESGGEIEKGVFEQEETESTESPFRSLFSLLPPVHKGIDKRQSRPWMLELKEKYFEQLIVSD